MTGLLQTIIISSHALMTCSTFTYNSVHFPALKWISSVQNFDAKSSLVSIMCLYARGQGGQYSSLWSQCDLALPGDQRKSALLWRNSQGSVSFLMHYNQVEEWVAGARNTLPTTHLPTTVQSTDIHMEFVVERWWGWAVSGYTRADTCKQTKELGSDRCGPSVYWLWQCAAVK